jgi:hypothetical protein
MPGVVLGQLPALPLHEAGKYVAGAYVVLFLLVLIYLAIMATRLRRIERELGALLEHEQPGPPERPVVAPELEVSRRESTLA